MDVSILQQFSKINNKEVLQEFFDWIKYLIEKLNLNSDDERLGLTVRKDNHRIFSVNINSRLVLSLENNTDFRLCINNEYLAQLSAYFNGSKIENFEGEPPATLVFFDYNSIVANKDKILNLWIQSCQEYLPKQEKSQYRIHHNSELYTIATNSELFGKYWEERHDFIEIDTEIIQKYWNEYKLFFRLSEQEHDEKYKWRVLKQVYETWDWEVDDKAKMFRDTFMVDGSTNLWESGNFWPISHANWMFENFEKETIEIFNLLFDETKILEERITHFITFFDSKIPELKKLINSDKINNHYHKDLRAIALYLSLQYPQKYFLYKFSMVNSFAEKIGLTKLKKGKIENLKRYLAIANQIHDYIIEDSTFLNEYSDYTQLEENYIDPHKHLLTQDFIYSVSKYLNIEEVKQSIKTNVMTKHFNQNYPLNQILYGPPGTGKTYKTKQLAVNIILGEKERSRKEIIEAYNKLVEANQIHFTTFHQSMSYEDFVEGIKPVMDNNEDEEQIQYEIQEGIFKRICTEALKKEKNNFDAAYDSFIKDLSEIEFKELKTPKGNIFQVSLNKNNNLTLYTGKEKNKNGTLTKENIQKQINGEPKFVGWEGYFTGVFNLLKKDYNLQISKEDNENKNFVLIIDEINRGNVSSIFGELITLIEKDKRLGKSEAITLTLPYSKKPFGVPPNVYIIGTMNTADRSVEALDTALRRRFSFQEIVPNSVLLEEVNYKEINLSLLLSTINDRIEFLIDKDHQIGHSYFLNIQSFYDLVETFKDRIIPLLEEYFYGDFGKIGLVLGSSFVKQKQSKNNKILAQNFTYDRDFIEEKELYEFIASENWTVQSFQSIYKAVEIENV